MAAAVKSDSKKAGKIRGKLPVKKSINMAVVGQKKTRVSTAILALILILLVAAAVGKFLVMDRFAEVEREEQKVRDLRNELSLANAKLDSFGELKNTYAHYTFADMTSEELRRVERSDVVELIERVDVVELIERVVLPAANLNSWNVRQNQLTLNVTLDTLQDTNMLAQILNEEDMVEFATVKNAVTNEIKREPAPAVSAASNVETPAEEATEAEEPTEGEAAEETPAEEAPTEETEVPEEPAEGEADGETETEGEPKEEKELLYDVTAQIIVYLTIAEKEG